LVLTQQLRFLYHSLPKIIKPSVKKKQKDRYNFLLQVPTQAAGHCIQPIPQAGIVNFAQALAEELSTNAIRVNVINPGRTATPMRFKAFGKEPEGSLLAPEKVAEASLKTLLAGLTGQVIDVRRNDE